MQSSTETMFSPRLTRRNVTARTPEKKPAEAQADEPQASVLDRVRSDKVTLTRPEEDCRRRTILIEKQNGSFGFTIQSYGIQYRRDTEVEIITYIDHVEPTGPAAKAGMREGDVILSINGQDMEQSDHQALVAFIKQCPDRLRMVVLFEDCVRKVNLHMRYIQLQRQLTDRMYALEQLCEQEKHFIASLRSQGRRVPSFYPAQVGYTSRAPSSGAGGGGGSSPVTPQQPHGPPPSYAEAIGRRGPDPRYLCYHRGGVVPLRAQDPRLVTRPFHQEHWRGRGKSWDNLALPAGCYVTYGRAPAEVRWRPDARRVDDRDILIESGFPVLARSRAKTAKSAESLLAAHPPGSEFDTSCFSCECLGAGFPGEVTKRPFSKPKSVENLLAAARAGQALDSLKREKQKEKRRSSLKLGRKGSKSGLVAAGEDDTSERSGRV